MISNGMSQSGFLSQCGVDMNHYLEELIEERLKWAEVMRLDNACDCYMCGEEIPAGTTSYPLQPDGYGFVWGSDGCFPDGASAMYACFACRVHWTDHNEEDDDNEDV